jgi:vacuolar protein sorting-associated protein 72
MLSSTEDYRRLELEKKKSRVQKVAYKGPLIRFQSVTMPLIEELPGESEINVDGDITPDG